MRNRAPADARRTVAIMFSSDKSRLATMIVVVSLVLGGSFWAFQGMDRAPKAEVSNTETTGDDGLVDSMTNQLDGVPTGDEAPLEDPRTGTAPDEFVVEFMKKLNEVNEYVGTNNFETATEIDDVYAELWAWAESHGLRIRAVLSQGAINAGDTQFTPQPAPFLELETADRVKYCAGDVGIFDPQRVPDDILRQALMAGSCEDFFAKVKPAAATSEPVK